MFQRLTREYQLVRRELKKKWEDINDPDVNSGLGKIKDIQLFYENREDFTFCQFIEVEGFPNKLNPAKILPLLSIHTNLKFCLLVNQILIFESS